MMKKYISIFIIWLFCFNVFATDYYVKNAGDDTKTGLDDTNAWKTIAKVNAQTFSATDNIYLNKGDTWAENITWTWNGVNLDAYGSGAKPIINRFDGTSDFNSIEVKNIQMTFSGGQAMFLQGIIYDVLVEDCVFDGVGKSPDASLCDITGQDSSNYAYDLTFRRCEFRGGVGASSTNNFNIARDTHDVLIEDCVSYGATETQYQVYSGASPEGPCYNITFRDNIARDGDDTHSGGGGFNIGWNTYNVTVERSYFYNLPHGGVGLDAASHDNIIRNNLFYNNKFGISGGGGGGGFGQIYNYRIYNNTVVFGPDSTYAMLLQQVGGIGGDNIIIKNNIFTGDNGSLPEIVVPTNYTNIDSDYNCFYDVNGESFTYLGTDYANLTTYQSATGQDANSIAQDPVFDGGQYALDATSPCIDAGADLWNITEDFRNLPRPQGAGFDIGAMEFGGAIAIDGVTIDGVTIN